jgi:hypothetical protein
VRLDIGVRIPGIALRVIHLHHADAALDEPDRHQTAACRAAGPVQLQRCLALLPDIEHVWRFGLHPVGNLHRLNRRLELRILDRFALQLHPIERFEEIQLAPLFGERELLVVNERDQLLRIEVFANQLAFVLLFDFVRDERALVHRRQKRIIPERRSDGGRHVGTEHDEPGQIPVVGAEAVREPRSERRPADLRVAGVHHQHRRLVVRDVGVHRADEADVVGARAHVGKQLAHVHAALPVLLERERRPHERAGAAFGRDRSARQRLPVVLVEHRLRIEAVDLRQAAVHEQEDDSFRACGVVELARIDGAILPNTHHARCTHERFVDKAGEREHAEAAAHPAERFAPRNRLPCFVWRHIS